MSVKLSNLCLFLLTYQFILLKQKILIKEYQKYIFYKQRMFEFRFNKKHQALNKI